MYEHSYNPYAKNLSAVKEYFKSPYTLVLGIARAVTAVLSLVSAILIASKMKDIVSYVKDAILQAMTDTGADSAAKNEVTKFFADFDLSEVSYSALSSLPSVIIAALTAAAVFIIYFKSRSKNPDATPMTGFTILFVFSIITLIGMILAAIGVFLIVALLFVLYAGLSSGKATIDIKDIPYFGDLIKKNPEIEKDLPTITLVIGIVLAAVAVFAFFFILFTAINRVRYYNSVRKSISSVDLQSKGAKPYGVMCILSAIGTGSSLLSTFSMIFTPSVNGKSNPLVGISVVSALSLAASFVALVMEAKLSLGYKKYIDSVKYGYNTPVAPTAPYSPFLANGGYFNNQNDAPQVNPYMPPAPAAEPTPENDHAAMLDSLFGEVVTQDAPQPEAVVTEAVESGFSAPEAAPDAADVEPAFEEPQPEPIADEPQPAVFAAPTCPVCGGEVDSDAPFCGNCGSRL